MQLENNYNAGLSKNYQISPPTLNFSKSAKLTINKPDASGNISKSLTNHNRCRASKRFSINKNLTPAEA